MKKDFFQKIKQNLYETHTYRITDAQKEKGEYYLFQMKANSFF